jgi:alpha-1,2-mannosyltransferase
LYRINPLILIFITASLWILIFFAQPHKEERFMFPIFPLIALLAAVTLVAFCFIVPGFRVFNSAIVFVFVILSVSRGYALHRNFSASIETYKAFHDHFVFNAGKLDLSGKHVS